MPGTLGDEGLWQEVANQMPGTPQSPSSGNVAAATATATIGATASTTAYLCGFEVTGAGATAASVVTITVTGLVTGTSSYILAVPAGVTVGVTPLLVELPMPIPASGPNTSIVVTVPSFGAGNTNCVVNAHGFNL